MIGARIKGLADQLNFNNKNKSDLYQQVRARPERFNHTVSGDLWSVDHHIIL